MLKFNLNILIKSMARHKFLCATKHLTVTQHKVLTRGYLIAMYKWKRDYLIMLAWWLMILPYQHPQQDPQASDNTTCAPYRNSSASIFLYDPIKFYWPVESVLLMRQWHILWTDHENCPTVITCSLLFVQLCQ